MATQTLPILPFAAPSKSQLREPSANPQPDRNNLLGLSAVCLMSLATGFNDIPPMILASSAVPKDPLFISSITTALPLVLGAILAAAFLDPLLRINYTPLSTILAITNLLSASAHGTLLLVASSNINIIIPTTVISYLLIGFSSCCNLTLASLSCDKKEDGTAALWVVHGFVAAGALLRMALPPPSSYHLTALGMALSTAGTAWLAFRTRASSKDPEAQTREHTALPMLTTTKGHPALPTTTTATTTTTNPFFPPPPATSTTILFALFTLTHHTLLFTTPLLLTSQLLPRLNSPPTSSAHITTAFWTGIATSRILLSQLGGAHNHTDNDKRKKKFVSVVLALAALFHLFFFSSLFPATIIKNQGSAAAATAAATAAAGFGGLLLGAVYPCAAGVFVGCMEEEERVSGVAVTVAFGTSGAVAGVFGIGLVEYLGGSFLLLLVVVSGVFGGMVFCWYALLGGLESVEYGSGS